MRRLIVVLVALAGCSPAQQAAWLRWHRTDPAAAVEWARDDCGALCTDDWDHDGVVEPEPSDGPQFAQWLDEHEPEPSATDEPASESNSAQPSQSDGDVPDEVYAGAALGGMASCGQWADEAWAAGWRSEGYDLGRVMYAESRCDPGAFNSTEHFGGHATGLMQIIDPTWPDNATACQGGLYDPVVNLRCALYLRQTYGWSQWVTY